MKIETKIRLGAVAAALNGLAALVTVSPRTALATTCNQYQQCFNTSVCYSQGVIDSFCNQHIPPGCTYYQGICLPYPANSPCPGSLISVVCTYR